MKDTKYTVLVVEDEKPLADAIADKLEQAGFAAVTARSVAQAGDYLESLAQVDLVWLDHYLPGGDGIVLVEAMKETETWKDIPIFLVSNTASSDKVYNYLKLGVNEFYVKSDKKLAEIVEAVGALLESRD